MFNRIIAYKTRSLLAPALFLAFCLLNVTVAGAQEQQQQQQNASAQNVKANAVQAVDTGSKEKAVETVKPKWGDYKGITIGMSAEEVRSKLSGLKDKGAQQDFFVLSDTENVQVYYDDKSRVQAISVNYANARNAPAAAAVVGEEVKAKDDGSIYKLVRYPDAGYWVAYSRTAGKDPLVIVTIQQIK